MQDYEVKMLLRLGHRTEESVKRGLLRLIGKNYVVSIAVEKVQHNETEKSDGKQEISEPGEARDQEER